MKPIFFVTQAGLRKWFENNHDKKTEFVVGYYKVDSGKPCITWSQSVDEALCFGWIDGIRKSLNNETYCIRFTPRRPKSTWSAVNIKKIGELTKQGRMHPAGIAVFKRREEHHTAIYSYENLHAELNENFEKKLRSNKNAWTFFESQPPYYKKNSDPLDNECKAGSNKTITFR